MAASSSKKKEEEEVAVVAARKGRLRQRYDGEYRLVAGCVPYRVVAGGGGGGELEVLMVSTPNRADLVFPKVIITIIITKQHLAPSSSSSSSDRYHENAMTDHLAS